MNIKNVIYNMSDDIFNQTEIIKYFKLVLLISIIFVILSFIIMGPTKDLIRAVILIEFMTVVAVINYYHGIIPDKLNLLFGIVGIIINLLTGKVAILSMILGLLIGGGVLFISALAYELISKREGIGGGVIKYVAVLGLWLGYKYILITMVIGFMGLIITHVIMSLIKIKKESFSPADIYFSFGAFVSITYSERLLNMIGWL